MVPYTRKQGKDIKATEGETSNMKNAIKKLIKEVIKEVLSEKTPEKFRNKDNKKRSFQIFSNQNHHGDTNGNYNYHDNQKTNTKCPKCGRRHEIKDCPLITGACFYCKKNGHTAAKCPTKIASSNKGHFTTKCPKKAQGN